MGIREELEDVQSVQTRAGAAPRNKHIHGNMEFKCCGRAEVFGTLRRIDIIFPSAPKRAGQSVRDTVVIINIALSSRLASVVCHRVDVSPVVAASAPPNLDVPKERAALLLDNLVTPDGFGGCQPPVGRAAIVAAKIEHYSPRFFQIGVAGLKLLKEALICSHSFLVGIEGGQSHHEDPLAGFRQSDPRCLAVRRKLALLRNIVRRVRPLQWQLPDFPIYREDASLGDWRPHERRLNEGARRTGPPMACLPK